MDSFSLFELFEEYKKTNAPTASSGSGCSAPSSGDNFLVDAAGNRSDVISKKMRIQEMISGIGLEESELDMYLNDRLEKASNGFDVLAWWKFNSQRYPVLSKLARDILGMPISSVASESTFSTGGLVIDDFRASLTPKTAQALICCQDWLLRNPLSSAEERLEFIEKIEQDLIAANVIVDNNIVGI